mgnify:FL=1
MRKFGKIKLAFVAALAAAVTAFAAGSLATPMTAKADEAVRTHAEYSLHTVVGGAVESTLNAGVMQYMRNGYVNLTTSGGGVKGAHGFKIALENYDFINFKTVWLNAKAISGSWGDVRALIKFYDDSDNVLFWNAKKAEPTVSGNSDMSISYMYQSYGFGQNTYAENLRDNNYIKVKTNVDTWYGLKFQTEAGAYEEIIDAAAGIDLTKIKYATVNFDTYESDVAIDIGEFYGETFDGKYVRLFTPLNAELTDSFDKNVPNSVNYTKSGDFATSAITDVSVNQCKYTITKQNDWKWCDDLCTAVPGDISEYNGFSVDVDNTGGTKKNFELYFKQGGATWSAIMSGALFTPEEGDSYYGDGRNIPAGFKGNITIPFTNLRNKFNTAGVTSFDLTSVGNLGVIVDCHEGYEGSFHYGNLKLINDAVSQYNEYRFVEDENGTLQYANILRSQYDGDMFADEILIENNSVNGSSTAEQWNKYNELTAGILTRGDYEKKYELTLSETHSDTVANQIKEFGEVGIGYRRKTVYNRVKYTATFDARGGSVAGVEDNTYTAVWGAELPSPTRAGYTFGGWFDGEEEGATELTVMPVENVSLVAKWTANTNTAYKVKCALEGDNGKYVVDENRTQTLTGTTDTTTSVTAPEIDGYVAQAVEQKNIDGDGSTEIVINYERKKYTVAFVLTNVDGTIGAQHDSVTSKWGATVVVTNPDKIANYVFIGWFYGTVNENKVFYGEAYACVVNAKDETVYAKFERVTAYYTVKQYTESLDGTYSEVEADRETKSGNAGDDTAAAAKTYAGFTAGAVTQAAIAEDGSTVIEIRYARNEYDVIFTDESGSTDPAKVKFGADVTFPTAAAKTGYVFGGWKVNGEAVNTENYKLGAGNVTFVAAYDPATDTAYVVKHYIENLDGTYSEVEADRENKTGTTGDDTAAAAKTYAGFTAGAVTQAAIAEDGSTVIEIRYARNEYTVTFKVNGEVTDTQTVKFGGTVTAPADPTVGGYTFDGWTINGEAVDFGEFAVPANDVVVEAKLTAVPVKSGCGKADVAQLLAALGALAAVASIMIIKK